MRSVPRSLHGPVGRALIELASPDGPSDLDLMEHIVYSGRLEELSDHVTYHRLDAPFVEAMGELGLQPANDHVARVLEDRVTRMRVSSALAALGSVLDRHDVDWVVVKGPMVSRYMAIPEHRSFNDLDVVIPGTQLGDALDSLIAAGADEVNHNWTAYIRHEVGELPLQFAGVAVDLHWSLVGLGVLRRTMQIPTAAMVRRRIHVTLSDGREVPGLDPVDELLHLCVHAALSGAVRLDQLRDIAVVALSQAVFDWDMFSRRAKAARVAPLVAHALDRSASVFQLPVDPLTVRHMGGASLKFGRWVDATGSPEQCVLRGLHIKSARNGLSARWRAQRALAQSEIARRLRPSQGWDFADPKSVLYKGTAAGGPVARSAFIDLAEKQSTGERRETAGALVLDRTEVHENV